MTRLAFYVVFLLSAISVQAQTSSLKWYNLKSVYPLTDSEAKEVRSIIEEHTDDSLVSYTPKSRIFNLATRTEVDLNALTATLNELNYFVADVTLNPDHNLTYMRAGHAYQTALAYFRTSERFPTLQVLSLRLLSTEAAFLQQELSVELSQHSLFIVEGGK